MMGKEKFAALLVIVILPATGPTPVGEKIT
jgi:hypothetical protein